MLFTQLATLSVVLCVWRNRALQQLAMRWSCSCGVASRPLQAGQLTQQQRTKVGLAAAVLHTWADCNCSTQRQLLVTV
jgi:hypothetical protein